MEVRVMRRQALLDCLDTIQEKMRTQWARSSSLQTLELGARSQKKWCKCQAKQAQAHANAAKASRSSVVKVCAGMHHPHVCAFHVKQFVVR
jgi:hypothetical protein